LQDSQKQLVKSSFNLSGHLKILNLVHAGCVTSPLCDADSRLLYARISWLLGSAEFGPEGSTPSSYDKLVKIQNFSSSVMLNLSNQFAKTMCCEFLIATIQKMKALHRQAV